MAVPSLTSATCKITLGRFRIGNFATSLGSTTASGVCPAAPTTNVRIVVGPSAMAVAFTGLVFEVEAVAVLPGSAARDVLSHEGACLRDEHAIQTQREGTGIELVHDVAHVIDTAVVLADADHGRQGRGRRRQGVARARALRALRRLRAARGRRTPGAHSE